ncbi:hypothetical protein WMY93_017481 [Mugilogobius chulae]|uniref:L1 transposable element RRM domain-containing protein n=1 Tax=Mugilogobius chulae TaxID=88201 RepID=A0AAW0NSQ7_9GOBI
MCAELQSVEVVKSAVKATGRMRTNMDHDYNLVARHEACGESVVQEIEVDDTSANEDTFLSKEDKVNWDHTPIKNKKKKRSKSQDDFHAREDTVNAVLLAVKELTQKMDDQTLRFIRFEKKIEENTAAIAKNQKDIMELQTEIKLLKKENTTLRSASDEHARYKRRWNLRLAGLPEKEDENVRDTVIGILTRIIPVSVDRLRDTVDTVHRLGKKENPATSNNVPRSVIIQFGMRTVRDEVWKKSKDARVCKELHISFKEDFSKEDRAARAKLWPLVQDARKRGKRAYLKEGYALIDNKRVDPD